MNLFQIFKMLSRPLAFLLVVLLGIASIIGSGDDLTCEGDECILDDDINGIWIDNISSDIAMISDYGWEVNIVGSSGDEQLAGRILARDGEVYDSFLSAYYTDGRLRTVYSLINGTVSSKEAIDIVYNSYNNPEGGGDLSLNLRYDAGLTDKASSLILVSGNWSYSDSVGYSLTLTIDEQGLLTGSDTSGCLYSGNLSVKDAAINIYQLQFTQSGTHSGCSQYMPAGQGQGMLMDTVSSNDTLIIAVTGKIAALASASIVFRLTRQ